MPALDLLAKSELWVVGIRLADVDLTALARDLEAVVSRFDIREGRS